VEGPAHDAARSGGTSLFAIRTNPGSASTRASQARTDGYGSPRLLVDDIDAVLVAVRAGRGIARPLSYQVVDDLAANTLVRLLPEHEPPPLPVQLVVPSARHAAAKVRAFLDHAARAFAALPAIRAWG
jgi:DNA-binding transcriptional LysR family regulator